MICFLFFKKLNQSRARSSSPVSPFTLTTAHISWHRLPRGMSCPHYENSGGSSLWSQAYSTVQPLFCVGMGALTLQRFLFPCVEVLWVWTTAARRQQRRKGNSLGRKEGQADRPIMGERCQPTGSCFSKHECAVGTASRTATLGRNSQVLTHLAWKKLMQRQMKGHGAATLCNKVLKDNIFSSKCILSGPSQLPCFTLQQLKGCS